MMEKSRSFLLIRGVAMGWKALEIVFVLHTSLPGVGLREAFAFTFPEAMWVV